jgi:hypothetical protein
VLYILGFKMRIAASRYGLFKSIASFDVRWVVLFIV